MPKENKKARIETTATGALKVLWGQGFFKAKKKNAAIIERFSGLGYNFSQGELGMALMRAKYLTRRGKRGSYEYIQKHPYVEDDVEKP